MDNSVLILAHDIKARENISQYITRHPASLKKIFYEKALGRFLYHSQYNDYFKENLKLFQASDFLNKALFTVSAGLTLAGIEELHFFTHFLFNFIPQQ